MESFIEEFTRLVYGNLEQSIEVYNNRTAEFSKPLRDYYLMIKPLFKTLVDLTPLGHDKRAEEIIIFESGRVPKYILIKLKELGLNKIKTDNVHCSKEFNKAVTYVFELLCERRGIKCTLDDHVWFSES